LFKQIFYEGSLLHRSSSARRLTGRLSYGDCAKRGVGGSLVSIGNQRLIDQALQTFRIARNQKRRKDIYLSVSYITKHLPKGKNNVFGKTSQPRRDGYEFGFCLPQLSDNASPYVYIGRQQAKVVTMYQSTVMQIG